MYLNNFSVRIPEGAEVPGGYVELSHNTQYTLVLRNNRSVRCDAYVEIDGQHVGTWRLAANGGISLERPAHDTGRFTFYKVGSPEAQQAHLNSADPNLGMVSISFTPEQATRPLDTPGGIVKDIAFAAQPSIHYTSTLSGITGQSVTTRSAGGTGLSGQSGQRFHDVGPLNYDHSQQTVIHLRLVCKNGPSEPRPLTSFSTPIPPPVR